MNHNLNYYYHFLGTENELMNAIDNANMTMFDNVPVLSAIAGALTRINFDADRLEKLFKRIVELDDKNIMAHSQLAIHYYRRNKLKLAIKYYKKMRKINPTFQTKDERFNKFIEKWKSDERLKKKSQVTTEANIL